MTDAPVCLTVRVPALGGPVAVRVWPAVDGCGSGRPVLLACHGWTDSGEVFGPLAQALGRRWTVVAPDAPAHGGTGWQHGPRYSVPAHVDTVTAVLDRLPEVNRRRAPVVALGHSMGALTAARLAAARRDAVVHLVLEEPARTTPRRSPSAPLMRTWLGELRETDRTGRLAYLRRAHPDWPADEHEPWIRAKEQVDPAHLQARVEWGEALVALLSEVPCPVTLVHGSTARGGLVTRPAAARCASVCPAGADVVELPTGHNPRREARGPFVDTLGDVLARHTRG